MRFSTKHKYQQGIAHIALILLAVTGALAFMVFSSYAPFKQNILQSLYPKDPSLAAAPIQSGNKITWQGKSWNVTGVNMPWYNWGCDFGCNGNGGVVQNKNTIGSRLLTVKNAGMHTVRWWVFPGDNAWQIQVDAAGKPIGINPAVYADFDAALQLADQYDLYYNFVLFNSATAPTRSWIDNSTHRVALAQVLGTLFAHYKDNPRVMSWEIFNEPEFQIWDGQISEANTVATAKAIADSVHANSNALVTIGNAFADGIPMWSSVNLDYYSPHWYDYMSSGGYCLRCNDYQYYNAQFGITKPIVLGETYLGTNTADDLSRLNDFYNKGYAGAWGWSLFSERTADQLTVNLTAAQSFTSSHVDIGPQLVTVSPTPTFAPTPTPTPVSTPTPTPTPQQGVAYTIYGDTLNSGWVNWSWGSNIDLNNTSPVYSGANSVAFTLTQAWSGLYFHTDAGVNTSQYTSLRFAVRATQANQSYTVNLTDSAGNFIAKVPLSNYGGAPISTGFKLYSIPLADLGAANSTIFGFVVQDATGAIQPTIYLDEAQFVAPGSFTPTPTTTPSATPKPGDIDHNGKVDIFDYNQLLTDFGKTGSGLAGDIDSNGKVDIFDYNILLTNFGK